MLLFRFADPLPSWLFLHQCLVPFHSSMGPAGVISRSLTHWSYLLERGSFGTGLQETSHSTRRFWAGNRCLRHPFSLVRKPRQGGGMCILLDLVNLAKDIIPATRMCEPCSPCSTGIRHPLGMAPCAKAPHPVGYPVGGFFLSLSGFSLPNFAHQSLECGVISLSARLKLNSASEVKSCQMQKPQEINMGKTHLHDLSM